METSESKSVATDNNLRRITRPSVTLSPRTRRSLKYVSYECYLNGAFNERGNELRSFTPVEPRDVAVRYEHEPGRTSGQAAHQRRGAADCAQYRQVAGAIAQSVKAQLHPAEVMRNSRTMRPATTETVRGPPPGYPSLNSVSVSAGKETRDEKQAQHFRQCQM